MRAHSAFGRNAGLSGERIRSLRRLDFDGCERRESAALNWVRCFLTDASGVPREVEEEFVKTFAPEEQNYIKASMKGMFCVNLFLSTVLQGNRGRRLAARIEKSMRDQAGKKQTRGPAAADPGCFPGDLRYHREHTWVGDDGRIGLTHYAQDQMGEIVFIEVSPPGAAITAGEPFGEVESNKSVSKICAPVSGVIDEVNPRVLEGPELINVDPYGSGWIAKVNVAGVADAQELFSAEDYRLLLEGR